MYVWNWDYPLVLNVASFNYKNAKGKRDFFVWRALEITRTYTCIDILTQFFYKARIEISSQLYMPASWAPLVCMGKLLRTEMHIWPWHILRSSFNPFRFGCWASSREHLSISRVVGYRECPCKLQSRVYASGTCFSKFLH